MLWLLGMPIDPEDARWLVDRLYADGAADAVEAGLWIDNAIDRELYTVALEPGQRDAMQRVMIDPPERLAELRGILAVDHRNRQLS